MSKLTFEYSYLFEYWKIDDYSNNSNNKVTNSVKFRAWLPDFSSRAKKNSVQELHQPAHAQLVYFHRHVFTKFLFLKWIVAILRVLLDIWFGRKMINKQFIRYVVDFMQKKLSFGLKLTRIIEGRSIQTTSWGGVYKSRIID